MTSTPQVKAKESTPCWGWPVTAGSLAQGFRCAKDRAASLAGLLALVRGAVESYSTAHATSPEWETTIEQIQRELKDRDEDGRRRFMPFFFRTFPGADRSFQSLSGLLLLSRLAVGSNGLR